MDSPVFRFLTAAWMCLAGASTAQGQAFEVVGERALGMGGAFVAVADDSAATWWNPAGLAAGPFLDLAVTGATGTTDQQLPAARTGVWSVALATPPLGFSYYRLRITDIQADAPTGPADGGREDSATAVHIRSLSLSQFGVTLLHTIATGVSVGGTVKYVRGTGHGPEVGVAEIPSGIPKLLDAGDELTGGDTDSTVDADLGLHAVVGAVRAGATVRNLLEPELGGIRVPRQIRAGGAFDGAAAGLVPVMVSVDVDLRRYASGGTDRRVVAFGAEHWVRPRRVAVRGGARFNTVGEQGRTVTAGASVAARAGLFMEGHAAFGSAAGERGWGLAARVSF